ncbi:hypothetical protein M8C21_033520 [Ambrosia artemisiifolia]|uniref:Uncharacterized protein n=1 Tax=Ambrosia artemisiifolia TaxID=4212 RepID=A0AAD5GHP8_AMBAR|nr:hypothetical protein M8C21_033520 [Ambrosia artemisiifolia]
MPSIVLQLLGCHGPLANHQPGRAFLDATSGISFAAVLWFSGMLLFTSLKKAVHDQGERTPYREKNPTLETHIRFNRSLTVASPPRPQQPSTPPQPHEAEHRHTETTWLRICIGDAHIRGGLHCLPCLTAIGICKHALCSTHYFIREKQIYGCEKLKIAHFQLLCFARIIMVRTSNGTVAVERRNRNKVVAAEETMMLQFSDDAAAIDDQRWWLR